GPRPDAGRRAPGQSAGRRIRALRRAADAAPPVRAARPDPPARGRGRERRVEVPQGRGRRGLRPREPRAQDGAQVRARRTLRRSQALAHRRFVGARGHARDAGGLQLRPLEAAGLRGPADGRLHRGEDGSEAVKRTLVMAAALLAGCSVGPDYEKPETKAPAGWGEKTDASTADLSAWWTLFNDEKLNRLVDRAILANHDLKIAAARIEESRAELGVIRGHLLPEIDARGSYSKSRVSPNAQAFPNTHIYQ